VIEVFIWIVFVVTAYFFGKHQERKAVQPFIDARYRYKWACRDVLTWCCEDEFRSARRVAAQIMAAGEGDGMNAGTPCGDEPCTVNGLREQLRTINAEQRTTP